jgi:nucleotide-binding universal stress UspA family protein
LQLALGEVLIATKGYGAREKIATFDRAKKLAEKLGAVPELVWVLRGQFSSVAVREGIHAAEAIADQILDIGARYSVPTALVLGHNLRGLTRLYRGDLADALKHLIRAISLNKENYSQHTTQDPGIEAHIVLAARGESGRG